MTGIFEMYKKMITSLVPDNLRAQVATEKGSIGESIKYILLGSILAAIFTIIWMVLGFGFNVLLSSAYGSSSSIYGGYVIPVYAVIAGAILIGLPIASVLFAFLGNAIVYILAKMLGGQGSFTDQMYHFSVTGSGEMIIDSVLGGIPCFGSFIRLAIGGYSLYVAYVIYRDVHKLSTGRAIALTLLPVLLLVIIIAVVFALYAAMIFSLLSGMSTGARGY